MTGIRILFYEEVTTMKKRNSFIIALALTLIIQLCAVFPVFAEGETPVIGAPAELSVSSQYNNKAVMTWTPVEGAAGYEVWRDGQLLTSTTENTYRNTGLKAKKKYAYQVRAYTADGKYSNFTAAVNIKAKKRAPKVLVVDTSARNTPVVRKLKKAGCKTTRTTKASKVDPKKYDALVIPGGGDIDASFYGQKNDSRNYWINKKLDKVQIAAVKAFAKEGKPILGICRGSQVINVAFGGTLNQHIGWHIGRRSISTRSGAWQKGTYSGKVYHSHHQAVNKLGKGLKATQWDKSDGTIEGIEHKTLPVYGVQWHPESPFSGKGYKLFKKFTKTIKKQLAE